MPTPFTYPNNITAGTPAVAAEVQDNFDDLYDWIYQYYQQALDTTDEIAAAIAAETGTWTGVTYAGTWADQGLGNQAVQYRKVGDIVYLRGTATGGSAGTMFTLPAGFRPPSSQTFPCLAGGLALGIIGINSAGEVSVNLGAGDNVYVNVEFQFSVTA